MYVCFLLRKVQNTELIKLQSKSLNAYIDQDGFIDPLVTAVTKKKAKNVTIKC